MLDRFQHLHGFARKADSPRQFTSIGQHWLDHDERYRRSREFIECLKGIWTNEAFTYKGDFYQFNDYPLKPKPLCLPDRPYPEIFQGGNSDVSHYEKYRPFALVSVH